MSGWMNGLLTFFYATLVPTQAEIKDDKAALKEGGCVSHHDGADDDACIQRDDTGSC